MGDQLELISLAKLAKRAERYDDMADFMTRAGYMGCLEPAARELLTQSSLAPFRLASSPTAHSLRRRGRLGEAAAKLL